MQKTAKYWINHLHLQPHPEGGYYKEIYRSATNIFRANSTTSEGDNSTSSTVPSATSLDSTTRRSAVTSIYYLLEARDFSAFHRLKSDELWYFHQGIPLHIHIINDAGQYAIVELSDTETGNLQAVIPPNIWFAAEVADEGYTLVSCAVAPGFEFTEFEIAKKEELMALYPAHHAILDKLCCD